MRLLQLALTQRTWKAVLMKSRQNTVPTYTFHLEVLEMNNRLVLNNTCSVVRHRRENPLVFGSNPKKIRSIS